MKRNHELYLNDMLKAIDKIENYIDGLTYADFIKNDMVRAPR